VCSAVLAQLIKLHQKNHVTFFFGSTDHDNSYEKGNLWESDFVYVCFLIHPCIRIWPDTGVCGENKKIKNKLNRKIEERRGERGRFSYNSLRYKHRLARSTGAS